MAIIPTENEHILIQFDLDGRLHWWPAVVLYFLPKISNKPTQRTKARVKYHEFMGYKEEMGTIKFLKAFELNILDPNGQVIGSASWKLQSNDRSVTIQSDS